MELKNKLILGMTHCGVIITKQVSVNKYGGGELKQESFKFNSVDEMNEFVKTALNDETVKSISCQVIETTTHSWTKE
jgi:hypothetical protein